MDPSLAERREQMLGLLAEKTLALACAVQQRALEAESADEMARLAGAFAKLGRSVRQSIALHARLEKERLSAPKPKPAPTPADPETAAVARKRAWIKRAVERCLWNEYDRSEEDEEETAFSLLDDLTDRLDELTAEEAFLDADVDALIARLCHELGLEPPQVRPPVPANGHAGPDRADSS